MGSNKKNGKKKKKEEEVKDVLPEVDKEFYEIQISDLNRKLSRMKSRTSDLENSNAQLEEKIQKLDDDRSDIIAYLEKTLKTKTNDLAELQQRFDGLTESMAARMATHNAKLVQMEQEYKSMQDELTSDVKLLMGKLNSLEEFRSQKEEMALKFSVQENRIAEQQTLNKKKLYEAEQNYIIEKNKLKKEMETRILQLSLEFQMATDVRIASTTKKMIRENIAINNELTTMKENQKKILKEYEEIKEKWNRSIIFSKILEEEKNKTLQKNLAQTKLVVEVLKKHEEAVVKAEELNKIREEYNILQLKLKATETELNEAKKEITELKDIIQKSKSNERKLNDDFAALKRTLRRLNRTIQKSANAVKEAAQMQNNFEEPEELIASKRTNLLNNLLKILNLADASAKETIATGKCSRLYNKGDLGFLPTDKKKN